MSEFNISIPGGESRRLLTGGKYCPADILVTAETDHAIEDAILDGSLSGVYRNERITYLKAGVFSYTSTSCAFEFPSVSRIDYGAFQSNSGVTSVKLPALSTFAGSYTFHNCTNLRFIDFGVIHTLVNAVQGCTNLTEIVLRNNTITALQATTVFSNTPFAAGGVGGKIYVPGTLIEQYKTATNWSAIYGYGTCTFLPLEGSQYA